jgi:lipopolysaccharide transport system permease protein
MKSPTPSIIVYDALGRDRVALTAWRVMFVELWRFRELIHRLLVRNVTAQFRQSFLGLMWIVLPPVATAAVFSMLKAADIMVVPMAEGAMPYALFALVGSTFWGFFSQVTMAATGSITNAGPLVSKIYFPREVLVFSSIGAALINLAVRLVVVALTAAALGYTPHGASLAGLLVIVPMMALGLGLGLLFAPLNAMTTDTGRLLEFAFQFGLFLAPTVYPTPMATGGAGRWSEVLYWVHHVNPFSHFLYAIHGLMEHGAVPNADGLAVASVISFLALAIGWRFFHACEPLVAERL